MTKAAELAKMGEVLTNSQIGGRRNIVINGGMQVSQRATSATGVGASEGYFTLDRFEIAPSTNGRVTMSQSTDTPDGFSNSLKLDCTTADTSIAAGEYFVLRTCFEGQDLQQLKKGTSSAEKVTVSFYVKGNASATYTCELSDTDNTRHNSQTFAVTTSWNRIVLTFVGDTTGTLNNDNAESLRLGFWLHSGTSYSDGTFASNTWHTADNKRVGDGQTSFFDSTDRELFITGLQMEIGEQATPFEHRSFGEELALCQRYHIHYDSNAAYGRLGLGENASTTICQMVLSLPTEMRAVPTLVTSGAVTHYSLYNKSTITATTNVALSSTSSNSKILFVAFTIGSANLLLGGASQIMTNNNADYYIAYDAEL